MALARSRLAATGLVLVMAATACGLQAPSASKSRPPADPIVLATAPKPSSANQANQPNLPNLPVQTTVTISAVGDCTFGLGIGFGYAGSWNDYFERLGPEHFLKGVLEVFAADDYTIANLEGPLTERGQPTPKTFNFRGPAKHAEALVLGSVEAVTLANNHSLDYGQVGLEDTRQTLDRYGITHFGNDQVAVDEVKGIKIGLIGAAAWDNSAATRNDVAQKLSQLEADIKIVVFHWGIEREYRQNADQVSLARHAIDSGADMVLGHHPHVLQGVETYQGKPIAYSLGNFSFGGNSNPPDKDSMIFQASFTFTDGELSQITSRIIPVSISSVPHTNDYSPVLLVGQEAERVTAKVLSSSTNYPETS